MTKAALHNHHFMNSKAVCHIDNPAEDGIFDFP